MTDVASTQAPCSPASFGVDPIDLLVPRPRPLRRSLALAGGLVLIIVAVVLGATTGLIRPRLGLDLAASYTEAGAASRAALSFNVPLNRLSPREAPARRWRLRQGVEQGVEAVAQKAVLREDDPRQRALKAIRILGGQRVVFWSTGLRPNFAATQVTGSLLRYR
jgi:hypothetical protein